MDMRQTWCRQGRVISPDGFSLYAEIIKRRMTVRGKLAINGVPHSNIRYADDTVIISGE